MFERLAYAAPAPGGAEVNPALSFLPLVLMFVIFYFLLIRPQQKKKRALDQMVQNLKKGDRIITSGGILGTVATIQNDYVVIKVGDDEKIKIEVLKSAVSGMRTNG